MAEWIVIVLLCIAGFEIIEHLGLPLFWAMLGRKRPPTSGPGAMIGKTCVVKEWHATHGKVTYHSELWQARCDMALTPGRKVVIVALDGLMLRVAPLVENSTLPEIET